MLALAFGALLWAAELVLPVEAGSGPLEPLTIEAAAGVHAIEVEVARMPAQRGIGLMHRSALAPHRGMFFDFGTTREVTMWMKNTPDPARHVLRRPNRPHRRDRRADHAAFREADTIGPAGSASCSK